jgi:MarR family transcriptional regulator, organic hydroperoxide resistance regulator
MAVQTTSRGARAGDPAAEAWSLMVELSFSANKPRLMAIGQQYDLSPMQLHALRALEPGVELTMSALAGSLFCDASNVTGIVDRLEDRGLIERRPAAHDRRVKMLAVTDQGARLREDILARLSEPPSWLAGLPRADQRALRDALRKAAGARSD